MIIDGESITTISFHGVQLSVSGAILYLLLSKHRIWVKMSTRLDEMYNDFCIKHSLKFTRLDDTKGD